MGLAASQATLLAITARIHDVEFEAQQIQYAKMRLALQEDEVQQKYLDALDEQTLTIAGSNGTRIEATFDNLCGLGSLNNNLGTNGHYIFYDADDRLIVPNDVYNGYLSYGGGDPYEFAMYMMVGKETYDKSKEDGTYEKTLDGIDSNSNNTTLQNIKKELDTMIDTLYSQSVQSAENGDKDNPSAENLAAFRNSIFGQLRGNNDILAIYNTFFANGDNLLNNEKDIPDNIANSIKDIQKKFNEYEYCLYKKNSGAETIYEKLTLDDNFDSAKFNYYVRWGQLIEREGGISNDKTYLTGCTNASSYGADIENNRELLNEMIMYGKISIDVVYDNKSGISSTPTSATTDSALSFQNKSSVDSTALKKAEAEYNRELKKINQIDKRYDMSLNRLETERNALTKQYDSVKKVAEDNIERTFGIFS